MSGSGMAGAVMEAAATCDIALPSFEEVSDRFGDADQSATAERHLAAGAATVVVENDEELVRTRRAAHATRRR